METSFFYDPRVEKIFSPFKTWPILGLRELSELSQRYGVSYWSVTKFVRGFQKAGLLVLRRMGEGNNKILYLTDKGQEFLFGRKLVASVDEKQLYHDFVAGKIMRSMLRFQNVQKVVSEQEFRKGKFEKLGDLSPDGILETTIRGRQERWALELELTRKSKERTKGKMEKSLIHGNWQRLLYISNSESIIELLKELLDSLTINKAKEKVMIMGPIELDKIDYGMGKSHLWLEDRPFELSQLLGTEELRPQNIIKIRSKNNAKAQTSNFYGPLTS